MLVAWVFMLIAWVFMHISLYLGLFAYKWVFMLNTWVFMRIACVQNAQHLVSFVATLLAVTGSPLGLAGLKLLQLC